MEIEVAIRLIEKGIERTASPQQWADLGAGEGLFTKALATQLSEGSTIYAIDKDVSSLNKIKFSSKEVVLKTMIKDFTKDSFDVEPLDGILMANSLHYVAEPIPFLNALKKKIKNIRKASIG